MAQDTLLGFPAHTLPFRRGEFTTLLTVCAFGSAPGQDPKTAKYAVLTPDRAGFPNRAKRSEGSDTTPRPKRPVFRRVSRCVRVWGLGWRVYPPKPFQTSVAAFVGDV